MSTQGAGVGEGEGGRKLVGVVTVAGSVGKACVVVVPPGEVLVVGEEHRVLAVPGVASARLEAAHGSLSTATRLLLSLVRWGKETEEGKMREKRKNWRRRGIVAGRGS